MKKITLLMLSLMFIAQGLSAGTYSGGSGTSGAPYQIADLDDLQELQNTSGDWGAYFIQTADIDASATSGWDGGAGFSPIGNGTTPFTGTYNGQGSTISSLTINRSSTSFVGMFWLINAGTVKNIGLTSASIDGNFYVGAVAGQLLNSADIENGFSSGTVTGTAFVGGLAGSLEDGSTLLNSGSVAAVSGDRYVGGLVGRNLATITNCYASGSVNGTVSDEGGLVGGNTSTPVVSNSFWDTQTSTLASSSGGTGKSTTEMKTLATYTNTATSGLTTPWDFIGTPNDDTGILDWWNMDASGTVNSGYSQPSCFVIAETPAGAGSEASPYIIASLNNLYWLTETPAAWVADKYYSQTADIAAYSTAYINSGHGFLPIANNSNFYGNYDGGGHLVTGLTINRPYIEDYVGFFGVTSSAVIQNLNLREVDIIVDDEYSTYTGGLIGLQEGGSITRCSCTGNVEGILFVGGLIGRLVNNTTTITECWSSGTVSGSFYIGGLIGNITTTGEDSVIVSNCYSTADVSASEPSTPVAGGLIGLLGSGASVTIERCYSTGSVTPSSSDYTGGFIGFIQSEGTYTATACFWDTETSVQAAAYGSGSTGTITGTITGKTTAEMKTESTFTDAGWDFTTIWAMDGSTNDGYAYLQGNAPSGAVLVWSGNSDSDWNNSANWSGDFVPTSSYNVSIPDVTNDPVIASNASASCTNLTVETGGSLTIQSDAIGTGSLIVNGTSTGDVTMQRYIASANWDDWEDGWHFISSPVADYPIQDNFTVTPVGDYDFFAWSEPDNLWINFKTGNTPSFLTVNGSNNFELGHGYMAAYKTMETKAFIGTINVSDVPITGLTISGSKDTYYSWHLLGNPYNSALSWYTDWTTSNIAGVAKIWNEAGKSYTDISAGEVIPATNGFMVQASGGTGSLTIPKSKRVHNHSFYKNTAYPIVKLKAHNLDSPSFQESEIRFNPKSSLGYDLEFDGDFLQGYAPVFYSQWAERNLSVNSLPGYNEDLKIPFIFEKNEGENFSIELCEQELILMDVCLIDKKTVTEYNLSQNPTYIFTSAEGDDFERFLIQFGAVGIEEQTSPNSNIQIWSANKTFHILNPDQQKGTISIINLIGQNLLETKLNGSETQQINTNIPSGNYIVVISCKHESVNKKVFVN